MFASKAYHIFSCDCKTADVLDALDIWCIKPHVVNRRLAGCVQIKNETYSYSIWDDTHLSNVINEFLVSGLGKVGIGLEDLLDFLIKEVWKNEVVEGTTMKLMLRKLIPRNIDKFATTLELVIILFDPIRVAACFVPVTIENPNSNVCNEVVCEQQSLITKSYCVWFAEKESTLYLHLHLNFDEFSFQRALTANSSWLVEVLLPRLKRWVLSRADSDTPLKKSQTLSLVNVEEYTKLYNELKKKYGPHFVEIWPESTDPLKFVYEDIAIATYILLVWKSEQDNSFSNKKQTFVDLGCGNGLLVHILTSEGHFGRGIDITSRKIWDLYGDKTVLQTKSIIANELIIEEDWIIGNHSDELTPWIPLIASRSSYATKYFVLPCCLFDFDSKFRKQDNGSSQYHTYLEYVKNIGEECGFAVEVDTLRIPSTKKICHIGRRRTMPENDYVDIETKLNSILTRNACSLQLGVNSSPSSIQNGADQSELVSRLDPQFVPRAINNDPRNCSKVNVEIKIFIIETVCNALLDCDESDILTKKYDDTLKTSTGDLWSTWSPGGEIALSEIATMFDSEILKELKCQCGGLQTLLKNNRNIFKVMGGSVSLRDYRNAEDMKLSKASLLKRKKGAAAPQKKTKLCWFYTHHPQGCVLTTEQCAYAHGEGDLKVFLERPLDSANILKM